MYLHIANCIIFLKQLCIFLNNRRERRKRRTEKAKKFQSKEESAKTASEENIKGIKEEGREIFDSIKEEWKRELTEVLKRK